MRRILPLLLVLSAAWLAFGQSSAPDALTETVTRMARVGRCGSPSFSPTEALWPSFAT